MRNSLVCLLAVSTSLCMTLNAFGQGFRPEVLAAWTRWKDAHADKYGWPADEYPVLWNCRPLRVQIRHATGKHETYQLLDTSSIYTTQSSQGIEKSIFRKAEFTSIRQQPQSGDWILSYRVAWDGTEYENWDPSGSTSFSSSRSTPRSKAVVSQVAEYHAMLAADTIQFKSETEDFQIYSFGPSELSRETGEFVLSKSHNYLPLKITGGTDSYYWTKTYDYLNADATEYRYQNRRYYKKDGDWVEHLEEPDDYVVIVDSKVSPDEFELKYYGIELEPRSVPYPSWWWLVVAGAVLIGLAAWLRRRNAS